MTSEKAAPTLQLLADRATISDLLFRYASSIDTRDWERFESCFTPDVTTDYGNPNSPQNRDHLVRSARRTISGFDVTHHMSTNHEITVDSDRAQSRSYLNVVHYLSGEEGAPGETYTMRGHYTKDYVRTADGWRINRLVLITTWTDGDPGLLQKARRRWEAKLRGDG